MAKLYSINRKSHFLGTKVRFLRKQHGLTLEDFSARCIQIDSQSAPSVSYLSLIETGRRMPSKLVLTLFCEIFQKEINWFMDDNIEFGDQEQLIKSASTDRLYLEPGVLFSKDLLETSIPEILSQTGTTGRQFAHVMIRAYQEKHKNQFPDLERTADEIGGKQFPLNVDDLMKLASKNNLKINWFEKSPFNTQTDTGQKIKTLFRSFYDSPDTVYINTHLQKQPERMKYELALHLAHKILHNGDGLLSSHATGGELGGSPKPTYNQTTQMNQQDILIAWRDFECSYFAGALLCPRIPFRRFLIRNEYDVNSGKQIGLTNSLVMRRMTSVSSYPHWHYFDAYPPGYLRAVYRGNGIPLPWGSMRKSADPCTNWALFRLLDSENKERMMSQISLCKDGDISHLYCCKGVKTRDAAGNYHTITVGIDLIPILETQGVNIGDLINQVDSECQNRKGETPISPDMRKNILSASRVLSIGWLEEALDSPISIICPRKSSCPRIHPCIGYKQLQQRGISWLDEIREKIKIEYK